MFNENASKDGFPAEYIFHRKKSLGTPESLSAKAYVCSSGLPIESI